MTAGVPAGAPGVLRRRHLHALRAGALDRWRGRPLARCRAFVLFELSALRHLAGSTLDPAVTQRGSGYRRWDQGLVSQFVYDLGAMVNVRAREAIGGTLTAGVIIDDPVRRSVPRPALTADVRLGIGDLAAATGRAMVATDGRGRLHQAVFVGVSVGSTVTAVVTGLIGYLTRAVGRGDVVTLAAPAR